MSIAWFLFNRFFVSEKAMSNHRIIFFLNLFHTKIRNAGIYSAM